MYFLQLTPLAMVTHSQSHHRHDLNARHSPADLDILAQHQRHEQPYDFYNKLRVPVPALPFEKRAAREGRPFIVILQLLVSLDYCPSNPFISERLSSSPTARPKLRPKLPVSIVYFSFSYTAD
jgi:hypothetical protein